MQNQIEISKVIRKSLERIMNNYSLEQLNEVPEGFTNNLIWNIAHVIVTQQLLVYKLAGLPTMISDEMIDLYKKGTKTERPCTAEEVAEIKELLHSTIAKTEEDVAEGLFVNYTEYPTSTGYVIRTNEDSFSFNSFHEGIHLGYVLALKKGL